MEFSGFVIILMAVFLECSGQSQKPDSFYISATGKTRAELIDSGDFFPLSAFDEETLQLSSSATTDSDTETENTETDLSSRRGVVPFKTARSMTRSADSMSMPQKNSSSIKFLLFNKDPALGETLQDDKPDSFFMSAWLLNHPVKLLVHGYKGDCFRNVFSIRLIEAYLTSSKAINIVCMDWHELAGEENYRDSAMLVPVAGERLAEFLGYLDRSGYVQNYEAIHIIGFCLGAQVAGMAGGILASKRGLSGRGLIGRITGLDPGFPATSDHLDSTDGIFVDVIHTNAGSLAKGYLGTTKVSGHADFYPNGGSFQPVCGSSLVGDIISTCSHQQAIELYAKSIKGTKYVGCNCTDWSTFLQMRCGTNCKHGPLMGENSGKEKPTGTFYLRT